MKKTFYLFIIAAVALLNGCEEAKQQGGIYGVITDKATEEPIRTAGVQLSTGMKTITGDEGQYEFTELEAGGYTLQISKTGYTEILNYKIVVEAGKTAKGDMQMEKLPPSLRVVNDKSQDIDMLDFGDATDDDITRSFNIFNDGPETLEWEITKTSDWISKISKEAGSLKSGATRVIIVTIDREKMKPGENITTLHITSDNGNKELKIKATNKGRAAKVSTLNVTGITKNGATFNGDITDVGYPVYTEKGFVYSTSSNPSVDNKIDKIIVTGNDAGSFTRTIGNLTENKTYYVAAYAINKIGIAYGEPIEFKPTTSDYIVLQAEGLMVQKYDISSGVDWYKAKELCENSTLGGYNDWRLPTIGELEVLYDKRGIIGNFSNSRYWSSTEQFSDDAWYLDFNNGGYYYYRKTSEYRVRAVRAN